MRIKTILSSISSAILVATLVMPIEINAMSIVSLSQTQGPTVGGNSITIKGSGFIENEEDKVKSVEAGYYYSLALTDNNAVYAWGRNDNGQLGTGDNNSSNVPLNITSQFGSEKIVQLAAGGHHSLALSESSKLFAWGYNAYGQLGISNTTDYNSPQEVTGLLGNDKIVFISAGGYTSFVITESGKVYAWGRNDSGQLGTGDNVNRDTPQDITTIFSGEELTNIAAGAFHTMATTGTDKVLSWGDNYYGQLGTGNNTNSNTPQDITSSFSGEKVMHIAAGGQHSLATTNTNKTYAWGYNLFGQVGDSTNVDSNAPQAVTLTTGSDNISQVVAGGHHSMVLTEAGKLYVWGRNDDGQLGIGDTVNYNIPQDATSYFGVEKVAQISTWYYHTISLTASRNVLSWGQNTYGQLGTIDNVSYNTPQDIATNFNLDVYPTVQVSSIYFGSSKVEQFQVIDANTISLIVPPHNAGFVDVAINDIHGGATTLANGYEYIDFMINAPNTGGSNEV